MVHWVLPRVVAGLLGELGPQRAGHTPMIGQIQQAENMHRPVVVSGRLRIPIVGESPCPVVRGDRVQDVGVHRPR